MATKMKEIKTVADFENATNVGGMVWDAGEPQNEECYAPDNPCPSCGVGIIFGADFPNGDDHGGCLNCGKDYRWDEEENEWIEE